MSSQIASQCLSVADFFSRVNWQGLAIAPTVTNSTMTRAVSPQIQKRDYTSCQAMCLTVGEFFGRHNWQGEVVEYYLDPISESEETIDFSLTLPVRQFFALMAWDGRSKLTTASVEIPVKLPEPTPTKTANPIKFELPKSNAIVSPLDDTEMSVKDLSSLF